VTDDLVIRRAEPADRAAILALLGRSLGWHGDERDEELFAWKHDANAFGPSPAWVALDGDRLVGVRVFLRWEFEIDGRLLRAVRAVDTATDPEYQGRGIFTRLTLHAVEEVRTEGVAFVFNTPNDQSRPGYLKMGWQVVGRLAARMRPTSIAAAARMLRARVPAERWSEESSIGVPAADVLDDRGVAQLCAARAARTGLRTHLDARVLRWRFGWPELRYRAVLAGRDPAEGLAILRVRRRGSAREAALAALLVPGCDPALRRALVRRVTRGVDADYLIGIGDELRGTGLFAVPGQGPALTWRAVAPDAAPIALDRWHLTLGDVELF
jgi:GNAT superfamily N-acetyltransferase